MSSYQLLLELGHAASSGAEAPIPHFGSKTDCEARGHPGEASDESLASDWSEKSALDKYTSRVNRAVAQYRRERAFPSATTWDVREARAYAELLAEQRLAMRELVTGEYWRIVAVREALHQEPLRTRQGSGQFDVATRDDNFRGGSRCTRFNPSES
jgi:hypothetical protein